MKPKSNIPSVLKSSSTLGTALAFCLYLAPGLSHGAAVFDFVNNSTGLDGGVVGDSQFEFDGLTQITLTTVDVVGMNGSLTSDGVENNTTSIPNSARLVVNSQDNFGATNEATRFNLGEAWIFDCDTDITLDEIRIDNVVDGVEVTISSTAFTTIVIDNSTPTVGGVDGVYSLGNVSLPTGDDVRIEVTGFPASNPSLGIGSFTVSDDSVATGANLVWAGSDGDAWNTVDANFTGDSTVFTTGDNVTIQTAGAINVDVGGITAGSVADTTAAGTVTLQTGNFTSTSFMKSGAGTLLIASPITLDAGALVALSGGTLQVGNGATLTAASPSFSGGATLQVDSGATLTVAGSGSIAAGGAILDLEEPVSLGSLSNNVDDVPFTKTGSAVLTFTGGLGVQSTGPVDLDILEGSVVAASGTQLNIGGDSTWNGDVTLDESKIEFHGSTLTGTGSILANSGTSHIDARYQGGMVNVANDIVLTSDIIIEAPLNGSSNSELHLNGPITGGGNVEKEGNGLVVLEATNTYLGTTAVNAGVLRIGNGAGSGSLGAGAVTITLSGHVSRFSTLEFARDDAVVISHMISGDGYLTVNCAATGSVELTAANEYTGVTTVSGGTLIVPTIADGLLACSIGAADYPAENLILKGEATISYTGPAASTDREFSLGGTENGSATGGGTISVDGSGPLTFTSAGIVGADGDGTAPRILTLAGTAPGTSSIDMEIPDGQNSVHSLVKSGSHTWALTFESSYTGGTTVEEGTLILSYAYLDDQSTVSIASGAILELEHGEADVIEELWLDGAQVAAGTWGSSDSSADNQDNSHFSGPGMLSVTTGPSASDYDAWAGSFSLVGGPTDDDDNDGVSNEDEYAFGLDPTSASSVTPAPVPLDKATGTFQYTRRNKSVYSTGLNYTYAYSMNLDGTWTDFTADPGTSESSDDGDPTETITVTLPASLLSNDALFVQVTAQ